MNSSEAIMVRKGNPDHVTGLSGLCGLSVAAETGTTVADFLATQSKACTASGKKPIAVQTFLRDSDALSQLGLGHVAAYGTTVESGGYDITKNGGMFELAGPAFGQIATGIATAKKDTALHGAIATAFAALRGDGTYKQIMAKWALAPTSSSRASDDELRLVVPRSPAVPSAGQLRPGGHQDHLPSGRRPGPRRGPRAAARAMAALAPPAAARAGR